MGYKNMEQRFYALSIILTIIKFTNKIKTEDFFYIFKTYLIAVNAMHVD